jgi:AbrB family looped-hinge helix DNA binding protein
MDTTKLSSKGQIVVPKKLRESYDWQAGLEFIVIDTGDGILLKPKRPFPATTVEDVAGCLAYSGTPKTVEEMDMAVQQGLAEAWHDRR